MNREEAIKILKDTLYDEKTPTDYLEAVKMGREALENQKTGHWKRYNGKVLWECSECGEIIYSETEQDRKEGHKYCNRCGAKMEGENNE